MTVTEFAVFQKLIETENLLVNKCKQYSEDCKDPQLKQKFLQTAAQHQDHFLRLINHFQ